MTAPRHQTFYEGLKIVVDWKAPSGQITTLSLRQLPSGARAILMLALDLARRMCQANPKEGVDGSAVVLIDEIDLHLHPRWQQTIVEQLLNAFPNVQFIMTTHSDQVLSTVKPESVRILDRRAEEPRVVRPAYTFGLRSEDILEETLGTASRAKLTQELADYEALVDEGQGRGEDAMALRRKLEEDLPADESDLRHADNELRRQAFLQSLRP